MKPRKGVFGGGQGVRKSAGLGMFEEEGFGEPQRSFMERFLNARREEKRKEDPDLVEGIEEEKIQRDAIST